MKSRPWRNEDGATAVLVAILVFVFFGATAIAVDLGSGYQTKRELVADTDAAALAGATHLEALGATHAAECAAAAADDPATGTSPTYDQSREVLDANRDVADANDTSYEMVQFDVTCGGGRSGQVTVGAARDATTVFAGAIGMDTVRPSGSSTAQYGDVVAASGLRPFGACYIPGDPANSDPHAAAWIAAYNASGANAPSNPAYLALKGSGNPYVNYPNPDGSDPTIDYPATGAADTYNSGAYGGYGVIHRIYFNNDEPIDGCGTESGGWGMICFDKAEGDCNDTGIRDLLEGGYDGTVDLGGPGDGDEDCIDGGAATDDCDSHTGQFPGNSERGVLDDLIDDEVELTILLFDSATDGGPGSNATYDPSGFLGVVLRGYGPVNNGGNFTGSGDERYLDLEFVTLTTEGRIGDGGGGAAGVRGIALCDVDGSTASQC